MFIYMIGSFVLVAKILKVVANFNPSKKMKIDLNKKYSLLELTEVKHDFEKIISDKKFSDVIRFFLFAILRKDLEDKIKDIEFIFLGGKNK